MNNLTPREIVTELDRHIVGQADAKKSVAIAIRNRWRRQQLDEELRKEVNPKNILMIGPTGVGKTEIARRLAKLTGAPFIKVEASKYTEVGYYGRDVESMIRELVENAIGIVRERELANVEEEAKKRVTERLLDLLAPAPQSFDVGVDSSDSPERYERTREKMRAMLVGGELENRNVEITRSSRKPKQMMMPRHGRTRNGGRYGYRHARACSKRSCPRMSARREMSGGRCTQGVIRSRVRSTDQSGKGEYALAVELAEDTGIIFIDEVDKVVASEGGRGADVSRQGVQRDLIADRGRHHSADALRLRAHRSHSVRRCRSLPHHAAQRPDARAARPIPNPRRAERPDERRLHSHSVRAAELDHKTVHSADENRRGRH